MLQMMDRQIWSRFLATKIPGPYPFRVLSVGMVEMRSVQRKSKHKSRFNRSHYDNAALIKQRQDGLKELHVVLSREVGSALKSVVEFMKINFGRNHLSLLNTFLGYILTAVSLYPIKIGDMLYGILIAASLSLYRRPPEAADSLDQPSWNEVQRCWMASAMAPEADLLGRGVSPRTDRGALGECAEAGMIQETKNEKAIGVDGIPSELVEGLCEDKKKILFLCNEIYEKGEWLEEFTERVLLPIPKKNNPKKCNEFRTISLISHSKKIILRILNRRWYFNVKEQLGEELFGFRKGKGTRDAIGLLRTMGEWRNLHDAELHAFYSSPDIIRNIKSRRLRWAGHVARMGESRNAYRVLVGRLEGKIPLRRPRRRWEDNIKMDLREVGYDDLAQDRDRWRAYVRVAMNLWVP
ncbi:hypothetical protein ANN_26608 [Periplaneta americana]|uniref:Uncharacterized protein n=1 Tax=Periplaneta americana TaxID=6978 RepID=A0ABQ8RYK1_PERAM|nr:hypothetical protein ANN_26608 [Periplaneta americana]